MSYQEYSVVPQENALELGYVKLENDHEYAEFDQKERGEDNEERSLVLKFPEVPLYDIEANWDLVFKPLDKEKLKTMPTVWLKLYKAIEVAYVDVHSQHWWIYFIRSNLLGKDEILRGHMIEMMCWLTNISGLKITEQDIITPDEKLVPNDFRLSEKNLFARVDAILKEVNYFKQPISYAFYQRLNRAKNSYDKYVSAMGERRTVRDARILEGRLEISKVREIHYNTKLKTIKKKYDNEKTYRETLEIQIGKRDESLREAAQQALEYERKRKALEKTIDSFKSSEASLKQDFETLKTRNESVENEINTLLADHKALEGRFDEMKKNHDIASSENEELKIQYQSITAIKTDLEEKFNDCQNKYDAVSKTLDAMKDVKIENGELKGRLKQIEDKNEIYQNRLDEADRDKLDLNRRCDDLSRKIDILLTIANGWQMVEEGDEKSSTQELFNLRSKNPPSDQVKTNSPKNGPGF